MVRSGQIMQTHHLNCSKTLITKIYYLNSISIINITIPPFFSAFCLPPPAPHSPATSSPVASPLPAPDILFESMPTPIIIMRKGEQIKSKRHPEHLRSPLALRPEKHGERQAQEAVSVNYQITVRAEKPRKCSDKLPAEKAQVQRGKKVKFITESIDKSAHDLLSARSKSNHRERSAKLSPHNAEEENAYELLRASKRSHQGERKSKSRGEEGTERKNVNPGNIRMRKEKSHSKERLQLNLKALGRQQKSTNKAKNGAKSSRKSEKNLQPRRFLSPELVKLENSYYFSNCDEEEAKPAQASAALGVAKKESRFIFESKQDFWNDPQSKRLLTSTLDLLN